ncbi:hypothetical protein TWF506_007763 [Arthrobotrys conoides]|uniref:CCHC-type domain-containing protein n=1 Tax=Arthrobotrys conoides TaxID=74498 RepID=A0AAN8RT53_9PEZI
MSGYDYYPQYDYNDDESPPPYSDEEMMDVPEYYHQYSDQYDEENESKPVKPKPKKTPAAGKPVVKKCRTCGNAGHDSRNCAINKGFTGKDKKSKETAPPPPPPPPPVQKKTSKSSKPTEEKACGACREIGHDRRSCPKLMGASGQQKQEEVVAVVKKFMETMAGAVASPAPTPAKGKSKAKKETIAVETSAPKISKQTAKKTVAPPAASKSVAYAKSSTAAPVKKQMARGKPIVPPASTGRGAYTPAVKPTWQMEAEKEAKPRQPQTARRSKPFNPLGASGSRGGGGIAKKSSEPATKKKKAPAANTANVSNGGINFTINWG